MHSQKKMDNGLKEADVLGISTSLTVISLHIFYSTTVCRISASEEQRPEFHSTRKKGMQDRKKKKTVREISAQTDFNTCLNYSEHSMHPFPNTAECATHPLRKHLPQYTDPNSTPRLLT